MKKFTKLLSLLFFLQVVWSSSIYGQVYSNDFSGGSVSGNTYVGTPTATPGPLSDYVFSTEWTATTGATMSQFGGGLRFSPLPGSGSATINLKIKVRCGYELSITGISFKHGRNIDGPQIVDLKVNSSTIATINPVPFGGAVAAIFTPANLPQTTLGEINVYLDLRTINAPATGVYDLDDFVLNGTYTYVGPSFSFTPNPLTVCEGSNVTLNHTITPGSGSYTSPTYQWQTGNPGPPVNVSGATGLTYNIPSVLEANQNNYRLAVSYAECVGGITETAAAGGYQGLDVNSVEGGSITPTVATQAYCSGASAQPLTVISSSGDYLPLTYQWESTPLNASTPFTAISGETNASYTPTPSVGTTKYRRVTTSTNPLNSVACSDISNEATITVNPLPTASIAATETSGLANNNGTICSGAAITLTASGGTGYAWSTGALVAGITPSNTATATYTVTVTDGNSCSASTSQVVTVDPNPTPSVAIAETSGTMNNDGTICAGASITLTASGGTSYAWSTGALVAGITPSNTATAMYTVTVTDANSCSATTIQTVTVNPLPTPTISGNGTPTGFEVCSGNNLVLTGSISGGTWAVSGGTYTSISPLVATTLTFTGLTVAPTSVTYTVTSGAGCTSTATTTAITVNALPANPTINGSATYTTAVCESNGTVVLTGSGGTFTTWTANGPASVTTNQTGVNTFEVTPLAPAVTPSSTYTVGYSVRNIKGCVNATAATAVITIDAKPSLASIPLGNQVKCDNPLFTVTATNPTVGTGVWTVTGGSPATSTANPLAISGVTAGTTATATWTVTNGSCAATSSNITFVTLTNNILPSVTASSSSPNCSNSTFNISASTMPNVGTGAWTSPTGAITFGSASSASTTAENVPFGSHTLTWTVTVGSGVGACTASTSIIVINNQPASTASIATIPQQACSGPGIFGVAANAPSVGTGVWTTSIGSVTSTGTLTAVISGVPQGQVAIASWTVTTPSGCGNNTATVTLTNYLNPTANAGSAQVVCNSPTTIGGNFTLNGTSTPPSATTVWSVTSGTIVGTSTANAVNINVAPGSTATATFTVTNGTCPPVASSTTITNYSQPTATAAIASGETSVHCGDPTFDISATPSLPSVGTWSGSVGVTFASTSSATTVATVPFGTSTITWTVVNGTCSATTSFTVTNHQNPVVTAGLAGGETANHCADNTFDLVSTTTVGAGTWTGGTFSPNANSTAPTATVSALNTPTTLTWTVVNGTCSTNSSVVVTNYQTPTASISGGNIVVCGQGATPFNITGIKNPTGAVGTWSVTSGGSIADPSSSTASVTVTPGSTVTLTYTVTNGGLSSCSSVASITITNHPALSAMIMPNIGSADQMCPGTSISLKAVPSGGSGTYSSQSFVGGAGSGTNYTVNFNGDPFANPTRSATVNGLLPQNPVILTYTVFDLAGGAGCSATTTFTTQVNPSISVTVPATAVCVGSTVTVTPSVTGGSGMFSTYSWSVTGGSATGTSTTSMFPVTGVMMGTADVTYSIMDNKGCPASGSTSTSLLPNPITVNPLPVITFTSVVNVLCKGAATGAATANGGTSYAWSNGPTTAANTGLIAGTYTVTVTTGSSCTASTSITITEPNLILAVGISSSTNVLCFGNATGAATAAGAGGNNASYSYAWSGTDYLSAAYTGSGATISGLKAGTYTVTVTDANSCTAINSVTISQPTAITLSISAQTNVSCNGLSNGSATVSASGGVADPSYTYQWSNMQTTETATGLAAGTYTVTVMDSNGCTKTTSATITQPAVLTATSSHTNVTCSGGSNGTATVTGGGGTSPFTYLWSVSAGSQTSSTATNLTAGTYSVVVTDAKGCTASTSATITQPSAVLVTASAIVAPAPNPNNLNIKCYGDASGSANASAIGGSGGFTYSWSGTDYLGATSTGSGQTITGLKAGTYTVTATDVAGCSGSGATSTVVLTQPGAALAVFAGTTPVSCVPGQGISNDGSIGATASNGVGGYMYQLSDASNTTILVPYQVSGTFSGLSANTYTITAKDANGCTVSIQKTLTSQTPMLTVTANVNNTAALTDDKACSGSSFTLDASSGFSSYAWSTTSLTGWTSATNSFVNSGQNVSGTVTQTPTMLPGMANQTTVVTYTVTASLSGCSTTASTTVTVNPLPYLTGVGSPGPTCKDAGAFGFIYTGNSNGANQITFTADNPGTPILVSPGLAPRTLTASPMRIDVIASLPTGNSSLTYTVTNSTTGCVSPSSSYVVTVNQVSSVTALTISPTSELCDGGPAITLNVTTDGAMSGVVGAFPRTVRIKKTVNSVVSTFDIIVADPGSGSIASNNTTVINQAGTYEVTGITDGATCGGAPVTGIPIRTLFDGRFTVTAPATNTTQVVYNGCSAVLTTAAAFNSTPSVGTLAYQWQVDAGVGFFANIGETNPTFTISVTNSMNGYKYRCKVTSSGSTCGTVDKYSNEITLSVQAFTVSAGSNQTQAGPTFNITGTPSVGLTSGTWSVVSGIATIANTNSASTTVTLAPNTTATLRWTAVAGSCSGTADVILTRQNIVLDAKVFLEGPLSGGAMSINIRSILPATSPYGTGENSVVIPVISVTDWIKVELRDAITPATLVEARSGLLLSNGKIVDMDGVSPIMFNTALAGTYHIAVIHRNHIDFRTNTALSFAVGTPTVVDFTIAAPNVFNTALKLIGGTTSAMYAGDADGNNRVNLFDYLLWFSKNNTLSYPYSILSNSAANADFNLNPGVNLFDYLRWFSNNNVNKSPNP